MRKTWELAVDGSTLRLDVEWDVVVTSSGAAWVNGVLVRSWWSMVKLPGVTEALEVAGRTIHLRQSWWSFDLDLRAAPDVQVLRGEAPYAGSGRNFSKSQALAWSVAITVAVVVPLTTVGLVARCLAAR